MTGGGAPSPEGWANLEASEVPKLALKPVDSSANAQPFLSGLQSIPSPKARAPLNSGVSSAIRRKILAQTFSLCRTEG
jgi:hypothetical protein